MKTLLKAIGMLLVFLNVSLTANALEHRVSRGETLSGIAAKYKMGYLALAKRNGIAKPYVIFPKQTLVIDGQSAVEVSASFKERKVETLAWRPVGDPLSAKSWKGPDALRRLFPELPKQEAKVLWEQLREGAAKGGNGRLALREGAYYVSLDEGGEVSLDGGIMIGANTAISHSGPVVLNSRSVLSDDRVTVMQFDGKDVVYIHVCNNLHSGIGKRPTPIPPSEEPTPKPMPIEPPPPAKEVKKACRLDPDAVIGYETEPGKVGAEYLSAALYCTKRDSQEKGSNGYGIAVRGSMWDGKNSDGRFDGHLYGVGPSYKRVSDKGWNAVISPMVFSLKENYASTDDRYQSGRSFTLVGVETSYNNYARRERGEKLFSEFSASATVAVPVSVSAQHSYDGKQIADTSDLKKMNYYVQAAAREYVLEVGKKSGDLAVYGQVNLLLESPSSKSGGVRVGLAVDRTVGAHIGLDKDFVTGGIQPAVGVWASLPF